jgi:hypothetical protein
MGQQGTDRVLVKDDPRLKGRHPILGLSQLAFVRHPSQLQGSTLVAPLGETLAILPQTLFQGLQLTLRLARRLSLPGSLRP